ncbi:MAG: hypothetical protein UV38_C0001G0160 [candidate division TM6 bacterium GW2011_GWE2_42_60]|nr:MAG: hypothetical protein UV38_C0001G0160 [candidate division TM6 bacterium GW2011_GWE2_42_60]
MLKDGLVHFSLGQTLRQAQGERRNIFLGLISLVTVCSLMAASSAERTIVDEIRVIAYHQGGSELILSSDIRPSLEGRPRSLRDIVLQRLMVLDADSLHIAVTSDDAERFLGELQKMNGISRDAMLEVFRELGYSYEEGLEQLRYRQMIEQILDVRVRTNKRLIVQRSDVEEYEKEHPLFEEAVYVLQQVCLPAQTEEERTHLEKKDFSQKDLASFAWEEPFEIQEHDLAEDKRFIADAQEGTVVFRDNVDEGVEITRMVSKKERRHVSLDERFDEVSEVIARQRFETLFKEYERSLLEKASLRFNRPEDKIAVLGVESEEKA